MRAAVGHGARLVLRFGNLAEIIFRKHDGVLLLGRVQRGVAHVEQIGAQRQMRPVLLQDAERQQARSLRTVDAFAKIGGGEFLPVDRKLGRRRLRQS